MNLRREAIHSEDYWEFQPGEHVMTIDGYPGVIELVEDGPMAGAENYVVKLDNGMGGGNYSASMLSKMPTARSAAGIHLATDDYPELGTVIEDRPDPGKMTFTAAATTLEPDAEDTQPSSCSYCGGTDFKDLTDNGRVRQATCATCNGTMSAHPGMQWTPELIGDPSNHPKATVDPRSGASPGAGAPGQAGINDFIDYNSRVSTTAARDDLDLYHRTSPEAAEEIRRTKSMHSKENTGETYWSTFRGDEPDAQGAGYGSGVVHVRVPHHLAEIEDEFPSGEEHYRVHPNRLEPHHFVEGRRVTADDDTKTIPTRRVGFAGYVEGEKTNFPNHGDNPDWEDEQAVGQHTGVHEFRGYSGRENDFAHWHDKGEITHVPLHGPKIYATQARITQRGVDTYLKDPGHKSGSGHPNYPANDRPIFVKHGGDYFTLDGHHRTAAAMLRGDDHIEGHVYDADEHGFPQPEWSPFSKYLPRSLEKYSALAGAHLGCGYDTDDKDDAYRHELAYHDDGFCSAPRQHKTAAVNGPDWCTWRRTARCTFPGDITTDGRVLGIPQDRGPCPWETRWQQQVCPISEPGPGAAMEHKGSVNRTQLKIVGVESLPDQVVSGDTTTPEAEMKQAMRRLANQMAEALGPGSANRSESGLGATGARYQYRQTFMTPNGYEDQDHEIEGPLYHGGRANVGPGDHLTVGRKPNSWGDDGGKSTHNYFTTNRETAASYARDLGHRGRLYEVEPTGDFKMDHHEHDFKTPHPLRVVREVPREEWE